MKIWKIVLASSLITTVVGTSDALADGGLDPVWGTGGVECTTGGFGRDIEILSDGSIYTTGYFNAPFQMIVNRTLPTSLPDTSFDGDGSRVLTELATTYTGGTRAEDLVPMSDGDVVLVGHGWASGSDTELIVVRLTSAGVLDTSFSGDGILSLDPSTNDDYAFVGLELSGGDLMIAGYTSTSVTNTDLFMARINSDGTLDTSFDGDGQLTQDISGSDMYYDMVRRSDGTFLLGGKSNVRFGVTAITEAGTLDTTFNSDGYSTVTPLVGEASSIALQTDGKIVLGGRANIGSNDTFVVSRLTSNGDLDTSFASTGYRFLDSGLTGFSQNIYDVLLLPDGKIVAAGYGWDPRVLTDPTTYGFEQLALFRLTTSGALDTRFNAADTPGYVLAGLNSGSDELRSITNDASGRIYGVTRTWNGSGNCLGIARFDTSLAPTSWSDQTVETATRGTAYAGTVASNLGASATYAVTSGTLPGGVTLGSNGTFTGTPTQSGQFPITITATTGSGTLDLPTTLTVNGSPLWSDLSSDVTVASATVGVLYSDGVSAVAYPAPTYSLASSTPPPGLTLNSNGTITGTPTLAGSFTFSVRANNGVGSPTTRSLTITVNQLDTFTTVTPARVADTRDNTGGVGTSKIGNGAGGGTPLQFEVLGTGNVPASGVAAVSLNVTAVDAQVGNEGGFVTVYPCLSGQPNVSNLNFTNGQTIPNAVIVPVDSNGNICVYVYGRAHIIIDVNGWFGTSSTFTPLSPQRIGDTRDNTGGVGTTKIGNGAGGGTALTFNVGLRGGVPASGVAAVSLNVTAVDAQVGNEGGFVTVYPCLTGRPNVSNLNFTNGRTIPNAVIVPVDSNGNICVYVYGRAHIIIDVNGWFG